MRPTTGAVAKLQRVFSQEAGQLGITLAYLFGSQAQGQSGPISDFDIAVFFSDEPPARERYALSHRLAQLLGTNRIDLVALNHVPTELSYSIIATGVPLYYESLVHRVEFEANSLSRYFDYLPILRSQRKELLEKGNYEAGIQRYRKALRATERVLAQVRAV